MIENVVMNSDGKNEIAMDREHAEQLNVLRDFMFKNVYKSRSVKKEEDLAKVEVVLTSLYNYFLSHPEKMPDDLRELGKDEGTEIAVKDYVAGMTDRYAVSLYTDIFVPDMTYGYRK